MARAQPRDGLWREAFLRRGHLGRPVGVVLVLEHQRHGAADGEAAADAADDAGEVRLDLLAAAPAVAALAARKVASQVVLGDLKAGWQAFDDDRQLRTVRFAGGEESKHSVRRLLTALAHH